MEDYKIVYKGGTGEIVEKKSRFIANVFPVDTEETAAAIIEEQKKKYWDARHNCYAYAIGPNGEFTRCSDDGEPSGTAGRPILEVITGAGLHNVLVVVTRYFGGTLLGTGGLVRAYSGAAQAGISASRVVTKQHGRFFKIKSDYNDIGKLQYIAGQMNLAVMDTEYTEQVLFKILVKDGDRESVRKQIVEATSGKAQIDDEEEIWFAVDDGKVCRIF